MEESGGSFSRDSDAVVSSEEEPILWDFRNETLFVLPCLPSSSEISKSLILDLLFPDFSAPAFFFLDLSCSFKKSSSSSLKSSEYEYWSGFVLLALAETAA